MFRFVIVSYKCIFLFEKSVKVIFKSKNIILYYITLSFTYGWESNESAGLEVGRRPEERRKDREKSSWIHGTAAWRTDGQEGREMGVDIRR